jgi:hypothetical protein
MAEYASSLLPSSHVEGIIRFLLAGAREDGWIPDRVGSDKTPVYAAGAREHPVGLANLDTGPYLVLAADELLKRTDVPRAAALFAEWEPALKRSLDVIPYKPSALVYNDPLNPHSPYGFTDCMAKTGELFMESLLCWNAFRGMERMSERFEGADTANYAGRARGIEGSIGRLYDEKSDMFFAATGDCRQIDIWGNAYMLYSGFPCGKEKAERVLTWLTENFESYLYEGQVRHLPKGQYWDRLLIEVPLETYQNGAYWATASSWVIWSIAQKKPALAAELFAQGLRYCLKNGFYECVNVDYQKQNYFVASGTNLLGAATRLLRENNTAFLAKMDELCGDLQ